MDDLPQKSIRTYRGDIEGSVQQKKTTVAQVVIAEASQRREESVVMETKTGTGVIKKILVTLASLILIGAGIFGGYWLYSKSPLANLQQTTTQNQTTFPSIISDIVQKKIQVTNASEAILAVQGELKLGGGTLTELVPVTMLVEGGEQKIPVASLFSLMAPQAPQTLARSITGNYLVGVFRGNRTAPFVILKNNYFQNALSGMFTWEPSMSDDLNDLFLTSTSTQYVLFKTVESFTDGLINNHDTRILKDTEGRTRLLYAFSDNETIVITTTEEALGHLLTTLDKQAFIRKK